MDWTVKVDFKETDDRNYPSGLKRIIVRTCPNCKDERVINASEMYDGFCPKCGQKMTRPSIDMKGE